MRPTKRSFWHCKSISSSSLKHQPFPARTLARFAPTSSLRLVSSCCAGSASAVWTRVILRALALAPADHVCSARLAPNRISITPIKGWGTDYRPLWALCRTYIHNLGGGI